MSPRKLTREDKQEILNLYRQTAETTSTLADRFGVSSSTISRFLKNDLSEVEYEELIQQKRLARTSKSEPESISITEPVAIPEPVAITEPVPITEPVAIASDPRLTASPTPRPSLVIKNVPIPADIPNPKAEEATAALAAVEAMSLDEMLGEDLADVEDGDDLEDDDWGDDDDDDGDDEDDEGSDFEPAIASDQLVEILPFSDAHFPRVCYLVIDRTAELISRPLKEFSHLGSIPPEETQQKTLPVFDNHRVARRFSTRFQRVIKVPDGKLLEKTSPHLQAKGITRILMEGRVYSLSSL